jgi:ribokinase
LVLEQGDLVQIPIEPVDPVDPTGAGDAFCAAFAAVHVRTRDGIEAAEAGCRAARLAVSGYGVEALLADAIAQREAVR